MIFKRRVLTNLFFLFFVSILLFACSSSTTTLNIDDLDINDLKKSVEIGQTKSEVKEKLGDKFTEINNPDGSIEWRFDIDVENGYNLQQEDAHEGKADVTAIELEKIRAQLFLLWEKEKVKYVSMFYKGEDNKVHIYELTSDGKATDRAE